MITCSSNILGRKYRGQMLYIRPTSNKMDASRSMPWVSTLGGGGEDGGEAEAARSQSRLKTEIGRVMKV